MPRDRAEYHRAYYLANKEKLHAKKRTPQSREVARKAEARYREKQRMLADIARAPVRTIESETIENEAVDYGADLCDILAPTREH